MAADAGQLFPGLAAVAGAEHRRVFHAGVHVVWVGQGWLEMPDTLEFPWPRGPVVPQMRAWLALIGELVSARLPRLAAVVRALNHLAEPARRLRGVEAVRLNRGTLDVVDLPTAQVRAVDRPVFALAVRGEDEGALA